MPQTVGTLAIWVKPVASWASDYRFILVIGDGGGNIFSIMQSNTYGDYSDLSCGWAPSGNDKRVSLRYTSQWLTSNQWNLIVVTWDTGANVTNLYLNNILLGTAQATTWDTLNATMKVGNWGTGTSAQSEISRFSCWSRVLGSTEITNLWKRADPAGISNILFNYEITGDDSPELDTEGGPSLTVNGSPAKSAVDPLDTLVAGYGYRTQILIDSSKVNGTLTDFPLLFKGTFGYLATEANGGKVKSANGYDIQFTLDAAGTTLLAHEQRSYDPATGAVVYWIRMPTLSSSAHELYIWYGNASATVDRSTPISVWDDSYCFVNHGNLGYDYCKANNGLGTGSAPPDGTGIIETCGDFDGSTHYRKGTPVKMIVPAGAGPITMSIWFKKGAAAGRVQMPFQCASSTTQHKGFGMFEYDDGASEHNVESDYNNANQDHYWTPDANWHYFVVVQPDADETHCLIYLDGELVSTDFSYNPGTMDLSGALYIMVGARYDATQKYFGSLEEARISKIARSADWIKTEYNSQKNPSTFYFAGVNSWSFDGTIASYPALASPTKGRHQWIYSGSIPSYPALESPTKGRHAYPYIATISSYPRLASPTYGVNVIPPPTPGEQNYIDLIVPLDIVDKGMAPDHLGGMGGTDFLRSMFILDTNDYDGTVTYEHQIIATNSNVADQVVTLCGYSTYGQVMSQITVPAMTTEPTMFSAYWTPNPGEDRYYWNVPDVGWLISNVHVLTGRVIVHQTGATKTLLWRPLATDGEGVYDGFNKQIGNYYSETSTMTFGACGTFYWNPALYQADQVTVIFEATSGSAYGDIQTTHCLWDMTDDMEVPGTRLAINSGGAFSFPSAIAVRKEISASLLQDGHVYCSKYARTATYGGLVTYWLSASKYYRSAVYIKLVGIRQCEVVWRVAKGHGAPVVESWGSSRARIQIPGGNTKLLYIKNETCSAPDYGLIPTCNYEYWITNDDHLVSGTGLAATRIPGSMANQLTDATPYALPLFSGDFQNAFVSGDTYCTNNGPATAGSDTAAAWTLVCLGFQPYSLSITPRTCPPTALLTVSGPLASILCNNSCEADSAVCAPLALMTNDTPVSSISCYVACESDDECPPTASLTNDTPTASIDCAVECS